MAEVQRWVSAIGVSYFGLAYLLHFALSIPTVGGRVVFHPSHKEKNLYHSRKTKPRRKHPEPSSHLLWDWRIRMNVMLGHELEAKFPPPKEFIAPLGYQVLIDGDDSPLIAFSYCEAVAVAEQVTHPEDIRSRRARPKCLPLCATVQRYASGYRGETSVARFVGGKQVYPIKLPPS